MTSVASTQAAAWRVSASSESVMVALLSTSAATRPARRRGVSGQAETVTTRAAMSSSAMTASAARPQRPKNHQSTRHEVAGIPMRSQTAASTAPQRSGDCSGSRRRTCSSGFAAGSTAGGGGGGGAAGAAVETGAPQCGQKRVPASRGVPQPPQNCAMPIRPTVWQPARRTVALVSAILLGCAALRLPSFAEPAWYSDEGTYANVGWALDHGARLYVDVWDNKPPGVYWLSGLLVHLPLPVAMPLAATVLTAIAAVALLLIARRLGGSRVAWLAVTAYVLIGSLPFLHGTLLNAEICGAACVTVAMALLVTRRGAWSAAFAGALAGVALTFKAVFAADVAAVLGVPLITAMAESREWVVRRVLIAAGGACAVVAAVAIVLAVQGSLAGALTTFTSQDTAYIATYGAAGTSGTLAYLLTAARLTVVIGAGAWASWRWARRGRGAAAIAGWWLAWDAAGAMLSGRGFPHYAQQAEPALCLAVALVAVRLWDRVGGWAAVTAAVAAVLIGVTAILWIPSAEAALAGGSLPSWPKPDGLSPAQMPAYYAGGYGALLGGDRKSFDSLFPFDLAKQQAAVAALQRDSAPEERDFVWGYIPWVYVLSQRMPAARYTTLNSAYYADPSAQASLLSDLEAHPPRVLIVDVSPAPPALTAFLQEHGYRQAGTVAGDQEWLLPRSG